MVFLIFFCFSYASELTERTKAVSLFRACVLADMAHTSRLLLALLLVLLHAPGSLGQSSFCCNNGFCSRASLTEVPSCLSSSITTLDLSFNRLTSIGDGSFSGLTSLQTLEVPHSCSICELFGNQLSSISDGAFGSLTSLLILKMANNQLTSIADGTFGSLTSLQSLD
eukprot:m.64552 g.64552  ORF g.64552 m.64552 type:complete len:168 (-) comp49717_c1_seq7:1542-2045(-)